jgi:hypothetical protein
MAIHRFWIRQLAIAQIKNRARAGTLRHLIIYSDGPLWLRILIALGAAVLVVVLGWRYYDQFWRRR